ncbi:MAG: hypothetical protein R3285_07910 [Kiloniellales bacterium]|nr:hypothetical protein [Kiloniellales bacterium]
MRFRDPLRRTTGGLMLTVALAVPGANQTLAAAEPQVIELTQIACQFLEPENGVDHDFETDEKADCERINAETGADRLAEAQVLTLAPGSYIFRVTNLDVPYELGFWVREHDYNWKNPIHKLTKTSVSGGGLDTGATKDYEVELEPGEYLYSCPLNPTPDYKLVVTN